jgi:hypothetical protein
MSVPRLWHGPEGVPAGAAVGVPPCLLTEHPKPHIPGSIPDIPDEPPVPVNDPDPIDTPDEQPRDD